MAGSSLFALIDDIATLLDDISVMTKVAAQKTAGVLGDDLALNAQQVTGINADRELPVVWAVAKGSLKNKAILVPAALTISALAPWAITPLLMLGGAYLCFEGVEKLAHAFLHNADEAEAHHSELVNALNNPAVDMVAFEQEKISGAIRTDFILSAEIITISLGTIAQASLSQQLMVLVAISFIMTLGVYGLVAAIVKLDDAGLYLHQKEGQFNQRLGKLLLASAPPLLKLLSVVGTAAMFLVGGSIISHGIPAAHDILHGIAHASEQVPAIGGLLALITPLIFDLVVGVSVGTLALLMVTLASRLLPSKSA